MMNTLQPPLRLSLFTILGFVAILSSTCHAQQGGLTVVNTAPPGVLEFGTWEYREVSTLPRRLLCHGYDFLQGTGWYDATWRYSIAPQTEETTLNNSSTSVLTYEIDRSWRANWCAAEPDEYNMLSVTYHQQQDDGSTTSSMSGYIRVVPNSEVSATSTTITCSPRETGIVESPLAGDLSCELANLRFTGRESIQVTVELDVTGD